MPRILIVDDKEQNRYLLQVLLESHGYAVSTASQGAEALDTARREPPDLIITDILMPVMDGFSLCRAWMADPQLQRVPLVFCTATYTDLKDEEFALSLGAARFIAKPVEPDDMVAAVRAVLAGASQRQTRVSPVEVETDVYLEQYNQALIRKLETKMVELEEANRALVLDIAARMEAEAALARRASQLELLNEIGYQVSARLDLDDIFALAARLVHERFGYHHVGLFMRVEEEGRLMMRAMAGDYSHLYPPDHPLALGEGMVGWAGLHGETLRADDVQAEPRYLNLLPESIPTCSELSVPIRIGDEILGVLDLQSPQLADFDQDDVTTMETLAGQLGVVINNARLYTQASQRNRELALLNQVIAATAAAADQGIDPALESVCREVVMAFEAPHAQVSLFDEEHMQFVVTAEHSATGSESMSALGQITPVDSDPAAQQLLAHRQPLVMCESQGDAGVAPLPELLRRRGIRSRLLLPLLAADEVVGSLAMDAADCRLFDAGEVELALRVAEQASGMLERGRLREQHRQIEEQFHQAQKMEAIGRLAAGVAHDFNNLLTVVHLSGGFLQDAIPAEDVLGVHVRRILEASQSAAGLTRQLLAFSRQQVVEPQVLDLNQLLENLAKMLYRLIGEDVALTLVMADAVWPVKVDPTQIEQVVVNLAVNARDAMPMGGRLTIETINVALDHPYSASHLDVEVGEYVLLAVSDNGQGMTGEVQAHMFEPFFTTKEQGRGSGLGLATVHSIVKQHGGHIWVYSEPGRGTTFKIYLPRVSAEVQAPAQPARKETALAGGSETLLVVEDEDIIRDLMESILTANGYRVLVANDGLQALDVAQAYEEPIYLLLTDLVLPGVSGQVLAERLRAARPEMLVLFTSGYTGDAVVRDGVLAEDAHFLSKPFDLGTLLRKVRAVLDGVD